MNANMNAKRVHEIIVQSEADLYGVAIHPELYHELEVTGLTEDSMFSAKERIEDFGVHVFRDVDLDEREVLLISDDATSRTALDAGPSGSDDHDSKHQRIREEVLSAVEEYPFDIEFDGPDHPAYEDRTADIESWLEAEDAPAFIVFMPSFGNITGFAYTRGGAMDVLHEEPSAALIPSPAHQTRCFECGELQFMRDCGWTCPNGHDGADGVDRDGVIYRKHPGEPRYALTQIDDTQIDDDKWDGKRDWFNADTAPDDNEADQFTARCPACNGTGEREPEDLGSDVGDLYGDELARRARQRHPDDEVVREVTDRLERLVDWIADAPGIEAPDV